MREQENKNLYLQPVESTQLCPLPAPRPRRRGPSLGKRLLSLTLSAALFGAVSAGSFYGVGQLLQSRGSAAQLSTSSENILTVLGSSSNSSVRNGMDVSDIAAKALPGVVSITNISVQEVLRYYDSYGFYGGGRIELQETTSVGSGVIIANDGQYLYMVTNQHVVSGAVSLTVSFADNSAYQAQLCGSDAELDLAVVKVPLADLTQETLDQITVIGIGNSDELVVGEQVVAIGNALGYGQSVTTGIVSALGRELTSESGAVSRYIQTDAAINPGNSGGALLNLDGELIGINTAKLTSTDVEGMGYAIPISDVLGRIVELMGQSGEDSTQSSSIWDRLIPSTTQRPSA